MSSDLYRIMIKLVDDNDTPITIDLDNLDELKYAIEALKIDLQTWADRVKSKLDECKQLNYPDFQEDAQHPALICSMVHSNSFIEYIKKIQEFQTSVLVPLELSIADHRY